MPLLASVISAFKATRARHGQPAATGGETSANKVSPDEWWTYLIEECFMRSGVEAPGEPDRKDDPAGR